jgi:hypothetical protein
MPWLVSQNEFQFAISAGQIGECSDEREAGPAAAQERGT